MKPDRSVLLASGDRLYAAAVRRYLEDRGWRVVATAQDGLQALAGIGRYAPHAVLILGDLPRLATPALARQVRRRWPQVPLVVVGGGPAGDAIALTSDAAGDEVLMALSAAPLGPPAAIEDERPDGVGILRRLTSRERLILKLLAEGLSVRDIATHLGVSQHTIRTHMQNLYAKLGAHSRLDVVRFAARHGLVSDDAEEAGR